MIKLIGCLFRMRNRKRLSFRLMCLVIKLNSHDKHTAPRQASGTQGYFEL